MGIGKDLENVKVGNNGISDGRNYDNYRATVEDVVDLNDRVINTVDPTDGVFDDVLAYLFGFLSLQSNLPLSITIIYSGQSYSNNLQFFLFTS